MAGRPAPRGGGLTGLHYALFSFVFVALAAFIAFVVMLTKVGDANKRASDAERRLSQYGSPPAYYADEANARGGNVFSVLDQDRQRLSKLVTGSPEAVGATVQTEAQSFIKRANETHAGLLNAEEPLMANMARLEKAFAEEKGKSGVLAEELAAAQEENKALSDGNKAARDEYEKQVAALKQRVEQLEAQTAQSMTQKDQQLTDLQANLESSTQDLNKTKQDTAREVRDKDLTIARQNNMIETLTKEVRTLRKSGFDPEAILTKADGRIIRAIPGSDIVYINVGSRDRIKVGMGFAVYSQTREAPKSLDGKASLEVLTLMEDTAECRVLRSEPGQPIIEGDIIVNIAFERDRLPKFLVTGEYDLDYNGAADFDGVDKVKALVRRWGGQVVDTLDETTDFIIIGRSPVVPSPGEADTAVTRELANDKSRELAQFRDLITRAQARYIPVINQNQFLYLIGYTSDDSVASR
ncbi:MAG: hypothetical protein JNG88_04105 [Phycisphaerales bacterium]|nr:hypothetical protein [Phycisphaerales bacterium]